MERRRVFFERNGIWKPGDAQKGTQKDTASFVAHGRSFQQLQMEMKKTGGSAELCWIDLEDGYPSTPHSLTREAERLCGLPGHELRYWRACDAKGEAEVQFGKEVIWQGEMLCGTVMGAVEAPGRFNTAFELPLATSDVRLETKRVECSSGSVKYGRESRGSLMEDATLILKGGQAMQSEVVTLHGDLRSVN